MNKKKILFDCRQIQDQPYSSASRDGLRNLKMLIDNSTVDTYILVYSNTTFHNIIAKIPIRIIRSFLRLLYLLLHFPMMLFPSLRKPTLVKDIASIPNIDHILEVIKHNASRVYSINKVITLSVANHLKNFNAAFRNFFRIETKDFDYMVLVYLQPLTIINSRTKKIIRYHDSFPIVYLQFSQEKPNQLFEFSLELSMKEKSYFVCNSEPTREGLLKLYPNDKDRIVTIPIVTYPYHNVDNKEKCCHIVNNRKSLALLKGNASIQLESDTNINSITLNNIHFVKNTRYILHVSTISTNKNQTTLVKAWAQFRNETNQDIKLIIIGMAMQVEDQKEITEFLRPYIVSGNLIQLIHVLDEEMAYLYSHAECFVISSFVEGFSMPPMEAMRCGCPCILSDIPEINWVYSDAALKINPHSADTIKEKLTLLLHNENKDQLKNELIQKGYERTKLFTKESIAPMWNQFLNQMNG